MESRKGSTNKELTLEDIEHLIADAARKIEESRKLRRKLEEARSQLDAEQRRLSECAAILRKEENDVKRLEGLGLTALFYQVLGRKDDVLDKERQEFLRAKLSYDQAKASVQAIETEMNWLSRNLCALGNPEESLKEALKVKEEFLIAKGDDSAEELLEIQEELGHLNAQRKEVIEAVSAGQRALESLKKVQQALSSAETWGFWDLMGGGLLTTAVKHSRIDEAQGHLKDAQKDLQRFQRELADLGDRDGSASSPIIGGFQRFADYFFDGLIIDWVVQSKIQTTLARTSDEISRVQAIVGSLNASLATIDQNLANLRKRRETVLRTFPGCN